MRAETPPAPVRVTASIGVPSASRPTGSRWAVAACAAQASRVAPADTTAAARLRRRCMRFLHFRPPTLCGLTGVSRLSYSQTNTFGASQGDAGEGGNRGHERTDSRGDRARERGAGGDLSVRADAAGDALLHVGLHH